MQELMTENDSRRITSLTDGELGQLAARISEISGEPVELERVKSGEILGKLPGVIEKGFQEMTEESRVGDLVVGAECTARIAEMDRIGEDESGGLSGSRQLRNLSPSELEDLNRKLRPFGAFIEGGELVISPVNIHPEVTVRCLLGQLFEARKRILSLRSRGGSIMLERGLGILNDLGERILRGRGEQ